MAAMEIYDGVKFETRFASAESPVSALAAPLVAWCRRFAESGLASSDEDASGNLSVRLGQGFLVTPTHVPLSAVSEGQLVHVLGVQEAVVQVVGCLEPSSETLLHAALYRARPDVEAVFHGHAEALVGRGAAAGFAATPHEVPYGTPALARLAAEAAVNAEVVILAGHGFVALGTSMDEAGARAEEALARVTP